MGAGKTSGGRYLSQYLRAVSTNQPNPHRFPLDVRLKPQPNGVPLPGHDRKLELGSYFLGAKQATPSRRLNALDTRM